jgi:hypothetical protein
LNCLSRGVLAHIKRYILRQQARCLKFKRMSRIRTNLKRKRLIFRILRMMNSRIREIRMIQRTRFLDICWE